MEKIKDNVSEVIELMKKNLHKKKLQLQTISHIDLSKEKNQYLEQENLITNISINKQFSTTTAGVDAGFLSKQLNFSNITLVKEMGVVFVYDKGVLKQTKYFPKINNKPTPYLTSTNLELEEIVWTSSILRLSKEISLSKRIMTETNLDSMFIDGSIIPQYVNKPTKDCLAREKYNQLIKDFIDLYDLAKHKKIFLIGCVEDSRGSVFFSDIKKKYFKDADFSFSDIFYVSSILQEKQRTSVVRYSTQPNLHPVLTDFPSEISNNLFVFYLKLSNQDFPLRIEFIYFKEFGFSLYEYVQKISSIVSSLSYHNKSYTYPLPLIEADLRSRLTTKEVELIIKQILEKTKNLGFRLQRRESRFF